MGVRAKSSYRWGIFSRGSLLRRGVCEIVNLVNVGLHVWFWWVGVGGMKKTPCGTYLMMYVVKTGMLGWARRVMMAMSLFVLCCTVYWASVEFLRPWTMWKIGNAREEFVEAVKSWEQSAPQETVDRDTVEEEDKHGHQLCVCAAVDDACSRSSCPHCSPTKSHFGFDREATLVVQQEHTPAQIPTNDHVSSPRISVDESAKSIHSSLEHRFNKNPAEPSILREVYESELYIKHCMSASPYQVSEDGKPLPLLVVIRSIFSPSKYRISDGINNPPSWSRCHLHTWTLFLTLCFPPQAFIVYSHLRQSQLLDPLNG
ncbi:hypothetical protein M3J09_005376 [Ascochyta lentis]